MNHVVVGRDGSMLDIFKGENDLPTLLIGVDKQPHSWAQGAGVLKWVKLSVRAPAPSARRSGRERAGARIDCEERCRRRRQYRLDAGALTAR